MASVRAGVRAELVRCSARGLDVAGFFEESGRILRRGVGFDGFCSMTVDPATMLLTSHIAHDSVRPEDVPKLGRNEFVEDDVNKFAELARAPRPVGVLTEATGQRPERSPRYRDILRPNGFGDELRVALMDGETCWGWMALYRHPPSGPFEESEAAFAASVSGVLGEGVRRSILLTAVRIEQTPETPGLILLGPAGKVEAVTPAAEHGLRQLIVTPPPAGELPSVVTNVAYRALLAARGAPSGSARARVPTSRGVG